jgi:hypothetical protein
VPGAADQFGFFRNRFRHDDEYSHRRGKKFTDCPGREDRL